MLRWYMLRITVRALFFLAVAAVCGWYGYAFATSPVAGPIVPLVDTIFCAIGAAALIGGAFVAFHRPPSWKSFTRADFRAQRRIIRGANRVSRRHKQSVMIPASPNWTLSVTYPNRREWPGELRWFIRYGSLTYLRISILCTPSAGTDPAEIGRSYAAYPLGGPSLKVGNGTPRKPSADEVTWLLGQLKAAANTSGH